MRWIPTRPERSRSLAVATLLWVATTGACRERLTAPIGPLGPGDASPQAGGTLRLASVGDVRNLDPAGPLDGLAAEAIQVIFGGLVELDEHAAVVPGVADHWDVEDGGRTYRFVLRRGVHMHDGDELTADDVVRSVERALDPTTPNPNASYFGGLERVVEEDRYVVSFRLKTPDATFLALLAMPTLRPTCKSAGRRYSDTWSPCGAGPFKLEPGGWRRGTSLRLVRHPGYFREGKPYLDAVEWLYNVQPLPQRFRFEAGDLDLVRDLTAVDLTRFTGDERWRTLGAAEPDTAIYGESMNTRLPPFDNVEIRRAVAAAIDREHYRLLKPANMAPLTQVLPPDVPGYDASFEGQRYDRAAALDHMRRAGFPYDPDTDRGGWPRSVEYLLYDEGLARYTSQILQQELAKIGIRIELKEVSYSAFLAMRTDPSRAGMSFASWSMDYPDPSAFFDPLFGSAALAGEATYSSSFYSNPDLDDLLDRAHHETNPQARARLYREANAIVCDEAPWAFTFVHHFYDVHQPYVRGFSPHPVAGRDVSGVWLDDPRAVARGGR
jgi:ABC-type transport system substrate-binding protein